MSVADFDELLKIGEALKKQEGENHIEKIPKKQQTKEKRKRLFFPKIKKKKNNHHITTKISTSHTGEAHIDVTTSTPSGEETYDPHRFDAYHTELDPAEQDTAMEGPVSKFTLEESVDAEETIDLESTIADIRSFTPDAIEIDTESTIEMNPERSQSSQQTHTHELQKKKKHFFTHRIKRQNLKKPRYYHRHPPRKNHVDEKAYHLIETRRELGNTTIILRRRVPIKHVPEFKDEVTLHRFIDLSKDPDMSYRPAYKDYYERVESSLWDIPKAKKSGSIRNRSSKEIP